MYPAESAELLLRYLERGNKDGVGIGYLKDREYYTARAHWALSDVTNASEAFFGHMPSPSWTIAHVRLATHGEPAKRNTHPFTFKRFAVVHNGVFSEHALMRKMLKGKAALKGETDSEVAGYLLDEWGPKEFYESVSYSGVFLGLHRKGGLWAVNTGGDLKTLQTKYGTVVASDFPFVCPDKRLSKGIYYFSKDGFKTREITKENMITSGPSYSGNNRYRGGRESEHYKGTPLCTTGKDAFEGKDYVRDKPLHEMSDDEYQAYMENELYGL